VSGIRLIAAVALVFVGQVAVISRVSLIGVRPDVWLVFVLAIAIGGGRNRGAVAGFFAGAMADMFMPSPVGLSALSYSIVGYAVGAFAEDVSGAPWAIALLGLAGGAFGFIIYVVVGAATHFVHTSVAHAALVVAVEMACSAVLTPLATKAFGGIWKDDTSHTWRVKRVGRW
jgi:rod shape-determining protein MreD